MPQTIAINNYVNNKPVIQTSKGTSHIIYHKVIIINKQIMIILLVQLLKTGYYLFLRTSLGPELEQTAHYGFSERGVLLQELHNAVGQLRVVQRQAFHLVQRQEHLHKELLVLTLQRQRKSVYYTETE